MNVSPTTSTTYGRVWSHPLSFHLPAEASISAQSSAKSKSFGSPSFQFS